MESQYEKLKSCCVRSKSPTRGEDLSERQLEINKQRTDFINKHRIPKIYVNVCIYIYFGMCFPTENPIAQQ